MCIHGLCQFPVRRGYQENVERASASSVVDHSQHVQLECTLSSPINTHSLNICGLSQKFLASLGNFGYKLNLLPEQKRAFIYILTDTHSFNGPFSGTTQVSQYQKGKTNLDFTGARDSEWQWHQLGYMQVCTSLQTDNHASTPPLSFFTGRVPFLPPNQQHQSTEGIHTFTYLLI